MKPALFLALAALLGLSDFAVGALALAWLGSIQLLNRAVPRGPIHWLHAMTFEPLALLGVAALRLIPTRQTVSGASQPILLVHGYMNHSSIWTIQKKRLEALGFGPIYTINFGHPFRSMGHYADKLKAKAEAIAQATGRSDLILIGFSMGGLVSAHYATQLAPPNTVTDIITIGTPFAGTPMAHIGLGPNAREMEPHSSFLQQLQRAMAQNKQIRFFHIATKTDQIVIPGQSAALANNQHLILEDIGHASMLYSRRVTEQMCQWLKSPFMLRI